MSTLLETCRGVDIVARRTFEHRLPGTTGSPEATGEPPFVVEGCPADRLTLRPHEQAQAHVDGGRKAGIAVDRSDKNAHFHWEQGWGLTGGSSGPTGPFNRPFGSRLKTRLPESRIINRLVRSLHTGDPRHMGRG